MPTVDKPHQQIEWVPIVFIVAACYIVTLLAVVKSISDAALQGAIGIATTFGGAAAGAYGSKMMQNRNLQTRAADTAGLPPDPTPPVSPAQP